MPVSYRQNFIPGSVRAMPEVDRSGTGGNRINRGVTTNVDPQGRVSRVSWWVDGPLSSGQSSTGETDYHADGSWTTTVTRNGGARTVSAVDAQGNYTERNYGASGALISESYQEVGGRRGNRQYLEQGGQVAYDFETNGSYLYTYDDGQGNVTRQWYTADNVPFDPNASSGALADHQADALVGALASFGAGADAGGATLAPREEVAGAGLLAATTLA